ncbi:MAG TPA: cation-binding protein [Nitrospiraceae bacterium]|jgi:hemerythrin-like domain-containing protein|nr:cation-binding protein [Nitrospiraceae bacterium]
MVEHRVIERMLVLLDHEHAKIIKDGKVDGPFIDVAIDFFATYVNRFHHGKEEKILFREQKEKPLSTEHKQIMDDLKEHVFTQNAVEKLRNAQERLGTEKGALDDVTKSIETLLKWYPTHIEKEDKRFFFPAMEYLSLQEQDAMLEEFWEFDGIFVHEMYMGKMRELEGKEK